jgi:hypothetical protein
MSQAELSRKNDVSFQQVQNTRVEPGGLEAAGLFFLRPLSGAHHGRQTMRCYRQVGRADRRRTQGGGAVTGGKATPISNRQPPHNRYSGSRAQRGYPESKDRVRLWIPGSRAFARARNDETTWRGWTCPFVPAQAGTQQNEELDSRFRGNDRMISAYLRPVPRHCRA